MEAHIRRLLTRVDENPGDWDLRLRTARQLRTKQEYDHANLLMLAHDYIQIPADFEADYPSQEILDDQVEIITFKLPHHVDFCKILDEDEHAVSTSISFGLHLPPPRQLHGLASLLVALEPVITRILEVPPQDETEVGLGEYSTGHKWIVPQTEESARRYNQLANYFHHHIKGPED